MLNFLVALNEIQITLILFSLGVIFIYKYAFTYWERRNVSTLPRNFLIGNLENPFKNNPTCLADLNKFFYDTFNGQNLKYGGFYIFAQPILSIIDLELIKNVLTRDYHYFNSHGGYYCDQEIISNHLFNFEEEKWKSLRTKLTPSFSPAKMKMMFDTLMTTVEPFLDMVQELTQNNEPINIKQAFIYYTTDVVGSCCFGINFNSYKNKDMEFLKISKKVLEPSELEKLRFFFAKSFPHLSRKLRLYSFAKEVNNFFIKMGMDIINCREQNNIKKNDYMQLLVELKNSRVDDKDCEFRKIFGKPFDDNAILAQTFLLFIAGFETSASTLAFAFYELAINQTVQNRARDEINKVLLEYDGKCTYEAIAEMKYLTQIMEETLRKYPIVTAIERKCTRTYKVPDDNLVIDKGTLISISTIGIHRNPNYYPNPMKFDPERFSEENKRKRNPYTFLAFGEGPRMCFGMRFGFMQIKVALVHLLTKYKFSINEKTVNPLEFDNTPLLATKGIIWLNATKMAEAL